MKKNKRIFQNISLLAIIAFSFIACDEDFSTVGSGIIGDNNFETSSESFPIIAYNYNIGAVRSNGLPSNLIGLYEDAPAFGTMKADLVGQMVPAIYNSSFGNNIVLDSVILNIPYYSSILEIDSQGNTIYELDSVYNKDSPNILSIYKNNYFLRDFDPNSEFNDGLIYFSDQTTSDGTTLNVSDLTGELLFQSLNFKPNDKQIILKEIEFDENGDPVLDDDGEIVKNEIDRIPPALRVDLKPGSPNMFWENLIFAKEGEPELSNANNFMDYFRGIYFETNALPNEDGNMSILNFSSGNITLYYRNDFDDGDTDGDGIPNYADVDIDEDGVNDNGTDEDDDGINDTYDATTNDSTDEDGDGITDNLNTGSGSFILNFAGNMVNFIETNYNSIPNSNIIDGDERLYLKGGADGNMAIIKLFDGENHDDDDQIENSFEEWRNSFVSLDDENKFTESKRLINEANLVFHVDQNSVNGLDEPDRIFIYDLKNNIPLIDYFLDSSIDPSNGDTRINHIQPLIRVDNDPHGDGIKYKIRITEHINNILLRDSTNVNLGLVVTSNINALDNLDIKGYDEANEGNVPKSITTGSFLSPKGTILFGNNLVDETKKVKLEIFYTEPN